MTLKVVNILGEPGSGKSTTTAGLTAQLALRGHQVELVQEAAKDFIWEASIKESGEIIPPYILGDQIFLFAEQNRRIERLRNKRDYAVVECPLLMSLIYKPEIYYKTFDSLVLDVYGSYNNINILLERTHVYDQIGRVQSETETNHVRNIIINKLLEHNIPYKIFKTNKDITEKIADYIESLK